MRVPGNPAGTRTARPATYRLVRFCPYRVPFQDWRAGRIDLAAAEPPTRLGLPGDRGRQTAPRRRTQIGLDPQRIDQRHAFEGFARQPAGQTARPARASRHHQKLDVMHRQHQRRRWVGLSEDTDDPRRVAGSAPEPPSAAERSAPAAQPRTAGRNSRTESSHRDHAGRRGPRTRRRARSHGRRPMARCPSEALCGSNGPARSPCGIQSEQPQNIPAQFRQFGIAAMPGIGTIDGNVGLDARGTVAEDDNAVGRYTASSTSWVTISVVKPFRCHSEAISACMVIRVSESSLPSARRG